MHTCVSIRILSSNGKSLRRHIFMDVITKLDLVWHKARNRSHPLRNKLNYNCLFSFVLCNETLKAYFAERSSKFLLKSIKAITSKIPFVTNFEWIFSIHFATFLASHNMDRRWSFRCKDQNFCLSTVWQVENAGTSVE